MSDAIKRALEVAGEAVNAATIQECDFYVPHKEAARIAAAAIAAFLEALPDYGLLQGHGQPQSFPPYASLYSIAAAVRRAAGGTP